LGDDVPHDADEARRRDHERQRAIAEKSVAPSRHERSWGSIKS
jgi:hypothetical protein